MNKFPFFSVILPIHRVDTAYLIQCLDSLRKQTFTDFEAILILNDSSDSEKKICNAFCEQDSRFKLFSLGIANVSAARNIGLVNALGSHIAFLDCDDFMPKNALENLFSLASTNVDVGLANAKKIWDKGNEKKLFKFHKSVRKIILKKIPNFAVWGYFFKKEIIKKYNITFNEQLQFSEDRLFIYTYLTHSKIIAYSNEIVYYYRQHSNSVCHKAFTLDNLQQQFLATSLIVQTLKENSNENRLSIFKIKSKYIRASLIGYFLSDIQNQHNTEKIRNFYLSLGYTTTSFNYFFWRSKAAALFSKFLRL